MHFCVRSIVKSQMSNVCSSTVWTQLAYLFKWRTAIPLGPHFFVISSYEEYQTIPSPCHLRRRGQCRCKPCDTTIGAYLMMFLKKHQSVVRGKLFLDHWSEVFASIFRSDVKPRQCICQMCAMYQIFFDFDWCIKNFNRLLRLKFLTLQIRVENR